MRFDFRSASKRYQILSMGTALGVLGVAMVLIGLKVANHSEVNHVSGAWLTLASDVSSGVFYRPLFSDEYGFGGTRFFPLFFLLQSLSFTLGFSPLVFGHLTSLCIGLLALIILLRLCYQLSNNFVLSIQLVALASISSAVVHGCAAIRGDLLPLLLNIIGLYLFMFSRDEKGHWKKRIVGLIVGMFVLAFATKMTSIVGISTVVLWLFLTGQWRTGVVLSSLFAGLAMATLLAMQLLSDMRMLEIFQTCASGGADVGYAVKAPLHFIRTLGKGSGVAFFLFLLALYGFRVPALHSNQMVVSIFFGLSVLQAILLFSSPGIESNHLVDLIFASVLVLAVSAEKWKTPRAPGERRARWMLIPICVFFVLAHITPMKNEWTQLRNHEGGYSTELTQRLNTFSRVLSEDPTVAIAARKKVYLQDAFMYKYIATHNPQAEETMLKKLNRKWFDAVVLMNNPKGSTLTVDWYANTHLNARFIDALDANYALVEEIDSQFIYLPK